MVRASRLAVAALAAAGALMLPAAAAAGPGAAVRMLACSAWQEDAGGTVTYVGRMRAQPGARRMALRFRLYEKAGDDRYRRLDAPGLGVWRRSRAGAAAFRYEQHVRGLRRGSAYRVVVSYRWYDAAGAVVRRARRLSAVCRQPGGLANLRIASLATSAGEVEGTAIHDVEVVNRGTVAARRVRVLLRVDGEVVDEAEVIEVLLPQETRVVSFTGPVCRSRLRAVVDPNDAIPESREDDNGRRLSCL